MPIQSLADIQAELARQSQLQGRQDAGRMAQLNARPASFDRPRTGSMFGGFDPSGDFFRSQQQANLSNQAAANQAAIAAGDPSRSPGAALNRIIGIGEQEYQGAVSNPVDNMLMAELSKRVSGQNVPYDATTVNALKTGAAEQSAAGEAANNRAAMASLEARGFTPADPAYQAALQANQAQRQGANQQANLSIAQQANLANYGAQGQAINQANLVNRGQQGQRLAAGQMATQALNQVSTQDMGNRPSWQTLPTFQQFQQQQPKQQKPATFSY